MEAILKYLTEKNVIIFVVIATIILGLLPFCIAKIETPPGKTLIGAYPVLVDMPTYLVYIRQGMEGKWLITDRYTNEPQKPIFLYSFYVLLGHVAKNINITPEFIFFLSRIILGLAYIVTIIFSIRFFLSDTRYRIIAYFLAFFASGFGWMGIISKSIDLWIPDAMPIARFFYFPHFILAHTLLLIIIVLIIKSLERQSLSLITYAGILTVALNIALPFHLLLLLPLAFLYGVTLIIIEKKERLFILKAGVVYFIISLPLFLIMAFWGMTDPVWSVVEKQNILPPAPIIAFLSGYGLMIVFCYFGILKFLKEGINKKALFLMLWVALVVVFTYTVPIPMSRRFHETSFFVPIAIIASTGLVEIFLKLKEKPNFKDKLPFFTFIIISFMITSNIYNLSCVQQLFNLKNETMVYLPDENIKAIEWIGNNAGDNDVIVSSFANGNIIPSKSDKTVYVGHGPMTINLDDKVSKVKNFYCGNESNNEMIDFLKKERITYVFYTSLEKCSKGNLNPAQYKFFRLVFKDGDAEIYKFEQ